MRGVASRDPQQARLALTPPTALRASNALEAVPATSLKKAMGACLSAPKTGADGGAPGVALQPGTVVGEGRHAFKVLKPIGAGSWAQW